MQMARPRDGSFYQLQGKPLRVLLRRQMHFGAPDISVFCCILRSSVFPKQLVVPCDTVIR